MRIEAVKAVVISGLDLSVVKMEKFNNYRCLLLVTCMALNMVENRSFRNGSHISSQKLRLAEDKWIKFIKEDLKTDKLEGEIPQVGT